MIEIEEGAIFVADSHYPHHGDEFLDILQRVDSREISTSQLFLMGDNFDILFGGNEYVKSVSTKTREAIELLNRISKKIDIYYFEGNHDFLLKDIFPHITIYPRGQQPQIFSLQGKRVGLSHGDRYGVDIKYELFSLILRSKLFLTILKPWGKEIIDDQISKLTQKEICHPLAEFEERVDGILSSYSDVDMVIEGHYHESKILGSYISLPSLACQSKVAVVRGGRVVFVKI
ncbi:FIG022708: hypothetical protein [hydrothermal vent metagenome]|uniref:Calcineurin-like phosphoesterase domain-containing protein n=1 Tax=hydrothermal vent metagenome TaxID=652676 RepID=A0A1W1B9P8_9ZZZZ